MDLSAAGTIVPAYFGNPAINFEEYNKLAIALGSIGGVRMRIILSIFIPSQLSASDISDSCEFAHDETSQRALALTVTT